MQLAQHSATRLVTHTHMRRHGASREGDYCGLSLGVFLSESLSTQLIYHPLFGATLFVAVVVVIVAVDVHHSLGGPLEETARDVADSLPHRLVRYS